ncbi:MAG: hypothetical protein ACRDRH_20510 [Pseudonocardia sp.]
MFDGAQLRRYRAGVDEVGEELERVLAELDPDGGLAVVPGPRLTGTPAVTGPAPAHRSAPPARPAGRSGVAGRRVAPDPEPLARVRAARRAVGPFAAWLDAHVGPSESR